uniref:Uncharacterized protein n=2 Tax=Meloidogyne incognita group TaxID=654580 RepID=A0A915M7J0_MELJA
MAEINEIQKEIQINLKEELENAKITIEKLKKDKKEINQELIKKCEENAKLADNLAKLMGCEEEIELESNSKDVQKFRLLEEQNMTLTTTNSSLKRKNIELNNEMEKLKRGKVFYNQIVFQKWYLQKELERTTGCKIHVRREGSEMHVVIEYYMTSRSLEKKCAVLGGSPKSASASSSTVVEFSNVEYSESAKTARDLSVRTAKSLSLPSAKQTSRRPPKSQKTQKETERGTSKSQKSAKLPSTKSSEESTAKSTSTRTATSTKATTSKKGTTTSTSKRTTETGQTSTTSGGSEDSKSSDSTEEASSTSAGSNESETSGGSESSD